MRFLPRCRARLIVAAESVGWATKNWSIDLEVPGVGPDPEVVPALLNCTPGTNTLELPAVDHDAVVELRVRDEAAATERRLKAVVHQGREAVDMTPAHGRGL